MDSRNGVPVGKRTLRLLNRELSRAEVYPASGTRYSDFELKSSHKKTAIVGGHRPPLQCLQDFVKIELESRQDGITGKDRRLIDPFRCLARPVDRCAVIEWIQ